MHRCALTASLYFLMLAFRDADFSVNFRLISKAKGKGTEPFDSLFVLCVYVPVFSIFFANSCSRWVPGPRV